MSDDLISRYKKSFRIRFQNASVEEKYRQMKPGRGQDSGVLAFATLFLLCSASAYLEFRAFGHDMPIPMYGYLLAAVLALINLVISRASAEPVYLPIRLVGNGLLAIGTIIGAVYLQKYNAHHAFEFILMLIWFASLKPLTMLVSLVLNVVLTIAFVAMMYITDVSMFRISLNTVLLASAVMLGVYIGYLGERSRRLLFLQTEANDSMTKRQELWAFTLIDLDMALSGIVDFKEAIGSLKKHLEAVIEFDSYVLTSLEGQGPKPVPDKIEGELFENEDKTLWSEDLLGKLNQSRQAAVSAEHEEIKGFLGMKKKRFTSYRLDVPIFNDSNMLGVISLRRASEPFDSLDMISSVSIASQAMLIFKRSSRPQAAAPRAQPPVIKPPSMQEPIIRPRKKPDATVTAPLSTPETKDMEMTDHTFSESDQTLVPKDVITQMKRGEESAKKTITLMSRENADKIAVDRYRTAAVDGEPLSVLIIEVDGLSALREKDGDEVAYKVFAAIVKYIFSKVDKEKDILGRYGQNGLSVLMPKVDMNAAERFAEMIREFVEKARYRTAYGEKTATLSIGVAAITDDTGDYSSMVKRADMALFVAKKNGRNCVKVRL